MKKKREWKGFILGFIAATLVFNLTMPALAATVKQITATYKNVQVVIDGKRVTPKDAQGRAIEPFISDGTTYLPIRGIASALGLDVDWDGKTNTVYLTSDQQEPVETPKPTEKPTPTPTPKPALDLSGKWKQISTESSDGWMSATITGDTIEVYWMSSTTKSLYWAGTYVSPSTDREPYSWTSNNDHAKTDPEWTASQDDTKLFTYNDGRISFAFSAYGYDGTMVLERE